jgi:molybdenum cofactor synthesis domain-containing protein
MVLTVAIITIGDEILSGDIVNTNATWIAKRLHDNGVVVRLTAAVGDNIEDISRIIHFCEAMVDWIFVTGGLGPTHDDITREAIAYISGRELIQNKEAQSLLIPRFGAGKHTLKLCELPEGCEVIDNPVGAAPGFIINKLIILPGVPAEMEAMFDLVEDRFLGDAPVVKWIILPRYEVELADLLRDASERFPDVKIGSYPQWGKKLKIRLSSMESKRLDEVLIYFKKEGLDV